jgi:hypothetical protein
MTTNQTVTISLTQDQVSVLVAALRKVNWQDGAQAAGLSLDNFIENAITLYRHDAFAQAVVVQGNIESYAKQYAK